MGDGGYYTRCEDYGFNFEDDEREDDMLTVVADFETTTDTDDCRVWAWCICDVYHDETLMYGNSIESFIEWCKVHRKVQMYFHNLGFDGAFIMDYLQRSEWEWVEDSRHVSPYTYTTLISDMNQVYCITLYRDKGRFVRIYDSLKIIPLSVKSMAKSYGLDEGKGDLDYEAYREPGHELTDDEKDYIRRDVQIVAKVLRLFLDDGLDKMTAGANALADYKDMLGGTRHFRRIYPKLTEVEDKFIRSAYRGGFTYVAPRFQGKLLGEGIVLDVNSLYPSVMAACDGQLLPLGSPTWFDGEYQQDDDRPLWVACVSCAFKLKPDHVPCIQLKNNCRFKQTEYIEDSHGVITFCTTSVDWKLINQQYDVRQVSWMGGYKFHANPYQFKEYVDKWVSVKNQATVEGNKGKRNIAKLMLNSLYGKFATRIKVTSRRPVMDEDGVVRYETMEPIDKEPVYLPVGVFVTAYARYKTITSAQSVYDRFVYADTDSLHLLGTELPDDLDVDPVRLGAWKHESTFDQAKFIRAKTYAELSDGKLDVKCAGMPAYLHGQVTLDNFEIGAIYMGKLYQKRVPGGIVLVPGEMEIRA